MKRERNIDANLPSSYKRLEYIQSTGTQYVDTGIKCGKDLEIHCVKRYTRDDINNNSDGVQYWDSNNIIIRLNYHNNPNRIGCYYGDHDKTINVVSTIAELLDWHTYDFKNKSQKIDGVEYAQNEMTVDTDKTYYIGKVNAQNGSYISYAQYKEYAFHKEGKCLMKLVPALETERQIAGFYDIVGKRFYPSQSQTQFLYK